MTMKNTEITKYLVPTFLGLAPILFLILGLKYPTISTLLVFLYWGLIIYKFEAVTKLVSEVEQGKNKIASLEERYSRYKETKEINPAISSYSIAREVLEYDHKNQLTKKQVFTAAQQTPETTVFYYDDHGRCIEETHTEMEEDWDDGELKLSETRNLNEYDDSGKLVRDVSSTDGYGNETIYKYDANDRLIEMLFPGNGVRTSKMTYEYLPNGKLAKLIRYSSKNKSEGKERDSEEYKYDEQGYCIEEIHHNYHHPSTDSKVTIKRDAKGNEIERCYFRDGEDLTDKSISKYDPNGNLVEKSEWGWDGALKERSLLEYDSNNRLILKIQEGDSLNMGNVKVAITFVQHRESQAEKKKHSAIRCDIPVVVLPKPEETQDSTEREDDWDEDDFEKQLGTELDRIYANPR